MELKLRTTKSIAEIEIEVGNAIIKEDLSIISNGKIKIPNDEIEKFINISREMNLFNNGTDIEFVKMVYEAFLNDNERISFLQDISSFYAT